MANKEKKSIVTNENKDLNKILKLLGKHKLSSILIIILFLIGGGVYAYFATPVYETYATVEVSNDQLDLSLDSVVRGKGLGEDATLIDTQVEIIKSRNLIAKAMKYVNYNVRYFVKENYKTSELYKNSPFIISEIKIKNPKVYETVFELKPINDSSFILKTHESQLGNLLGTSKKRIHYQGQHNFGEKIDNKDFSFVVKKVGNVSAEEYSFVILDDDTAIDEISKRLNVFPVSKNGSIIKMVYQDNVAQRAKDFLDALVNNYLEQSISSKTSKASSALKFVDEQLREVSKKLQESAIKLENFKEENNLVNIDTESDVTLRKLSDFQSQLAEIKIQESAFNALYNEFKNGNYGAVSSLAKEYPVLATLLSDLQKAKSNKIKLLAMYTENHPDVEKANQEIEDIKMALESAIESISDNLREKRRSIEDTIYTKETMLLKLPEKERELADLQRKYRVNEKTYQFLLEKQAEMSINKASTVSSNRVLDRAVVAKEPVSPKIPFVMLISILLGFVVAIMIALMREMMDHKVKTTDDLSNEKLPFYGVVPYVRSTEKMFVIEDQQSIASEALRLIRTNLEFIPTDHKSKVIVVTSTVPGEGKTTIAANLAAVFGMSEKRTIVISLDMRRPMLHKVFGLTNKVGMSTVLAKKSDLKEVIWEHKQIKNLDIITSGPIPPNPSELMQAGKIEEVIDELRKEYDYIIIDAPPMGSLTDALILMKLADISLVIFKSEYSEKEYVKSLEDMINSYDIKNVGLVLNAVKPKNMSQSFIKYSYTYK